MNYSRRGFIKNTSFLAASGMGFKLLGNNSIGVCHLNKYHALETNALQHKKADTEWFKNAKWGVFCHYLTDKGMSAEEWNRQVEAFDTEKLADQLSSVGTSYFFLTIGQNSGHYCSPNKTYDSYVEIHPSKCSKRDLISDLYESVVHHDIKLLVYLPSGAPAGDLVARKRLKWEWGYEVDWPHGWGGKRTGKRLVEFQIMWENIIREWSLRWGRKISGWWIDGCYFADEMYRHSDPPNFQSFAAALKSGNPDSIVAFNPGVKIPVISHTEYEDYTTGEISKAFPVCTGRMIDGAQYHILSYLGQSWSKGLPRFCNEFVIGYTKDVASKGGVVTWDVPIEKNGLIPREFLSQLDTLHCI